MSTTREQISDKQESAWQEWHVLMASALICGVSLILAIVGQRHGSISGGVLLLYLVCYVAGGWDALVDTWQQLRRGKLDIHFLMLAVAIGAASIGAWWEGGALLFLFTLSEALESMAMARTEKEIQALFHESPKQAQRLQADGTLQSCNVNDLVIGDVVRVLPGEQFPVDARVVRGDSAADESMLTGESVPVDKTLGAMVYGGTLNVWGVLEVQMLRAAQESAQGKIIRLIREAQASKAPTQRFTDRFGSSYTIGILLFSCAACLWWHYVRGLPWVGDPEDETSAVYRAMTLLVVCSPCALVLSIPSAILAGIAAAARRGVLFRGGVALENLSKVQCMAMDKTGTLTKGEFVVVGVESLPAGFESQVLEQAAALSQSSTHPLSRAIAREWHQRSGTVAGEVTDLESVSGKGLRGKWQGVEVAQGRRSFFSIDAAVQQFAAPEIGLSEVVVQGSAFAGRLLLRDGARPESAKVIAALQQRGVRVAMLTGDRAESADLLAGELGLDEIRAGLSPDDKVEAIQSWKQSGKIVAMVGDGVNDAPSLAAADVAVGMGLRGSDAVLELADVMLLQDQLEKLLVAWRLSHACRRVMKQNVIISLGMLVFLAIGSLGFTLPLPLGVFGHEGSTVIVLLNSLRLLWIKEDNVPTP